MANALSPYGKTQMQTGYGVWYEFRARADRIVAQFNLGLLLTTFLPSSHIMFVILNEPVQ